MIQVGSVFLALEKVSYIEQTGGQVYLFLDGAPKPYRITQATFDEKVLPFIVLDKPNRRKQKDE